MTAVEPLTAFVPVEPDADWETVRARVMAEVASTGPAWTDHNGADPGVTIAEVLAYGLADLHFRVERPPFDEWPLAGDSFRAVPDRHWHAALPVPALRTDPETLRPLAATLAATVDALEPIVRAAAHRADADARLAAAPWRDIVPPDRRSAVIAVLRDGLVRRSALEFADLVSDVVDAEDRRGGALSERDERAARRLALSLPLWTDELEALIRRERRRRSRESARARAAEIAGASTASARAGVAAALSGDGLTADEAELATAAAPLSPGLLPEQLERTGGATRVWPPHGVQALTCEPVSAADYARRARAHPGVARAWAVKGRLDGIAWHGLRTTDASSLPVGDLRRYWAVDETAAAITLVVERDDAASTSEDEFLREVLQAAIGEQVRHPFLAYRDDLDAVTPRRMICDEVGAALLKRIGVIVQARLVVAGTAAGADIVADVTARLRRYLRDGRPESAVAEVAASAPSGPWPDVPQPSGGWNPGEPIRFTEIVEQIVSNPDVLGVEALYLGRAGESTLIAASEGSLAIPPDAVPELAEGDCLAIVHAGEKGCGHAES